MTDSDERKTPRGHGVALFSGGLDSTLAVLLVQRQSIRVTALTFMTHFGCDVGDRSSCGSDPYPAAERFGFEVKLMHLGQKFVDMVREPKHGRGKHMNPCTDCRILMLREARDFMEMCGADFVFTGEVLGQRPMSQLRNSLNLTAKQAGLKGRLLRPLSAKLLKPTEAELSGLIDREQLEAISGRGRKRQMELAQEFGLEDYRSPAGGCLLTDAGYSRRLRDLWDHQPVTTFDDLNLLRVGRHFRLDERTKAIVGRNEAENRQLVGLRRPENAQLEALGVGSPITLLIGDVSQGNLETAAALTARYCDAKREADVAVTAVTAGGTVNLTVAPMPDALLDELRI